MPADFIKNKTEIELTGLDLGCTLTKEAVVALYEPGSPSRNLAYILHTEPSIPRTDGYGLNPQAVLQWYTPEWVSRLTERLLYIAHYLSLPPALIEIHPGDARNSIDDIINAVHFIQQIFHSEFATRPLILLENRTQQFLSTGHELARFATRIAQEDDLKSTAGIVLDIQQLFTRTKDNFLDELHAIPIGSVKSLHIHSNHRTPSESDPIPWRDVFSWIKDIPDGVIINPEVHHRKQVHETIQFCEVMLD
jgi:hypothetical protein